MNVESTGVLHIDSSFGNVSVLAGGCVSLDGTLHVTTGNISGPVSVVIELFIGNICKSCF